MLERGDLVRAKLSDGRIIETNIVGMITGKHSTNQDVKMWYSIEKDKGTKEYLQLELVPECDVEKI